MLGAGSSEDVVVLAFGADYSEGTLHDPGNNRSQNTCSVI
jgi:hypothetical protein